MNINEQLISTNLINRQHVLTHGSRTEIMIHDGPLNERVDAPLASIGLLTHLTLRGDVQNIERVRLYDLNNMTRVDVPVYVLPRRRNCIIVPLVSVDFDGNYFKFSDLRGAIFLNVTGAQSFFTVTGKSRKLAVMQHVFDRLPLTEKYRHVLPILDLTITNRIIDMAKR